MERGKEREPAEPETPELPEPEAAEEPTAAEPTPRKAAPAAKPGEEDALQVEMEAIREDIEKLQDDLAERLGKRVEAARRRGDEREDEEIIDEFAEESPGIKKLAGQIKSMKQQLDELLEAGEEFADREETTRLEKEIEAAVETFALTPREQRTVLRWMKENPRASEVLTFEESAYRTFGREALEARRVPPRHREREPAGGARGRIIPDRAGGVKPSSAKPYQPGPGRNFDDINRRRVGLGGLKSLPKKS